MFGQIVFEKFEGLKAMPQKAASAWSAVEALVGNTYKPLFYFGAQPAKGFNHWFMVEISSINVPNYRKIVKLAVEEFNGEFKVIPHSVKEMTFEV